MNRGFGSPRRYVLHGLAVELTSEVDLLDDQLQRLLGEFAVSDWPSGFHPISGCLRPYDEADVLRHLSPTAVAVPAADGLTELYQQDETFWLIDDRWGLCEINLLRGHWRSWVLPASMLAPEKCVEMAVLWPMAQLLRAKGLWLLPAASAWRAGWGVLLICPFGIEPELQMLIRSGYRLIGQSWTALREEDGKVAMLHLPGQVERHGPPRLRLARDPLPSQWIDLTSQYCGASQNHGFCDAVAVIEPSRRPRAFARQVAPQAAAAFLRRAWPIVELHPHRRHGQLAAKLASRCPSFTIQLSNTAEDLLVLLDSMRRVLPPRQVTAKVAPLSVPPPARSLAG